MGTKWAKWIQVAPQLGAVFAKVDLKWNWCFCYIAAANRSSVARKPSIAPSLHQLKLHQWIRSVHICLYPSLLNYHALALSVRAGFDARVPTLRCARPTAEQFRLHTEVSHCSSLSRSLSQSCVLHANMQPRSKAREFFVEMIPEKG